MKEAAGEANITVITIVLIALVLAVGTPVVKGVLKNAEKNSCCTAKGGVYKQNPEKPAGVKPCYIASDQNGDPNNVIGLRTWWDVDKDKCLNN